MTAVAWTLVAVGVLAAAAFWLSSTATRLDRMHHRVDLARQALTIALLRRSGTATEVAACEALDPATRLVLIDAARAARQASRDDLEAAESTLSQALRAAFDDPEGMTALVRDPGLEAVLGCLAEDCRKVELACRFHNDAVITARRLRSRGPVRWLRLAGHAGELRPVELDDRPPRGLVEAL